MPLQAAFLPRFALLIGGNFLNYMMDMEILQFFSSSIDDQARALYLNGSFVVAIRYYGYKINLYLIHDHYVEVFYNHKLDRIEKIILLDYGHSRMKFYADQISIPSIAS